VDGLIRNLPGTFIGNPMTKKAMYSPPAGERMLRDKLFNWERFIHAGSDIDPLVTLADLFEQPYYRISSVMTRCKVSRPTATGWLNSLVEAGALIDARGGREGLFVNTGFSDLLARPDAPAPRDEPTLF